MSQSEHKAQDLVEAVKRGDNSEVSRLLAAGANPNDGDGGLAPVMHACFHGDHAMIRELVAYGADVDYTGNSEGTPLTFSATTGNVGLMNLLMDLGASVNLRHPIGGETALHKAAFRNRLETVQGLLAHGADPNLQTGVNAETALFEGGAKLWGETALHFAAAYADMDVIQALLDAGADKASGNAHGEPPIAYAGRHQRQQEILERL